MTRQKRLRLAREEAGLTQDAVANELNISPSTYRGWESTSQPGSLDSALKVCKLLNLDIEYYISGTRRDEHALELLYRKMPSKKKNLIMELAKILAD